MRYALIRSAAQLAEMGDKLLVVASLMNVKAFPDVAANHYAAEAQFADSQDILLTDASLCHYVAVNDALASCFL